jgi:hypothetical protein
MRRAIRSHLDSRQVARVIHGAIIGLALVVALEEHLPSAGVVAATLVATAVAVALAELYSDFVGTEAPTRRRLGLIGLYGFSAARLAGVGFGRLGPARRGGGQRRRHADRPQGAASLTGRPAHSRSG